MNPGLRASASGMMAQQTRIDTIANNLANVNTPGFKRSRVTFEDMLYETLQGAGIVEYSGANSVAPIQIGRGVRLATIRRIHTQGAAEPTGRPLDLAIEGNGFFQIQRPDGAIGYTRDGSFGISDTGTLVTHGGHSLVPPVTIPMGVHSLAISQTGVVSAQLGTDAEPVELGQIQLARFMNPSGLLALGENLYAETAASGRALTGVAQVDGFGRVLQGMLETSNVEIVQEMVDMITAQRAYEVNSRAIRTADEMIETATNGLVR
jgi:flagellar basal-body rod protein FlgG